jgi:heme exporter protein A
VAGVDLRLDRGERLAVVGPNGAGKSTLLRLLATVLRPDAGDLRLGGHPCPDEAPRARRLVGYLGHDPLVYLDLSARQNLELYAALHGVPDPGAAVDGALRRVGLLARSLDPVRELSRGLAQRLGLARLFLHEPALLLLDEPDAGLDAPGRRLLDELLAERRAATGLVVVSHDLERALQLGDRVLVLRGGRQVAHEAASALTPQRLRGLLERT